MINIDFTGIELRLKKEEGKTLVFDPVRKKWLVLTPEEHVRQYLLQYYIHTLQYPPSLIAIEKKITVSGMSKRFDITVYNRQHIPWLLTECKAPDVMITEQTLHQLLQYHSSLQCRYWVMSNGHQCFCAEVSENGKVKWLDNLPGYDI